MKEDTNISPLIFFVFDCLATLVTGALIGAAIGVLLTEMRV